MEIENRSSFDTNLFITKIENFPCIWNYTSTAYNDRVERENAWEYLCRTFYYDYEHMDNKQKKYCVARLQRRWKSLRDCYNREIKRNAIRSRTEKIAHRKYLYFDQLYFLKRVTANTLGHCEGTLQKRPIAYKSTAKNIKLRQKNIPKNVDKESAVVNKEKAPSDKQENETDSDMHFLLSLYDRFKAIDSRMKIDAQVEILNVIQKYSHYECSPLPYQSRQPHMPLHIQQTIHANSSEFGVSRSKVRVFSSENTQVDCLSGNTQPFSARNGDQSSKAKQETFDEYLKNEELDFSPHSVSTEEIVDDSNGFTSSFSSNYNMN
ncbi:hypothetical protein FQA39_LY12127 [Lamprigera yunnana]|nr:hypothetical protein FQA39_LY12127 [Lamprigera yunnana]